MISESDILKASILIVDDRQADISLLERGLRDAGFTSIASTMNSREVCELHRKNRYALILLDLRMPDMDGFQVMEGLKAIETEGYLSVLVLTAHPPEMLQALKAGARDFVSKPINLAEVLLRVHNLLEIRLLHQESSLRARLADTQTYFVEGSLRESEERYRLLLDGIKDYAIFMMDPRGQILSWNAGAERMKGYRAEEIIGQNFSCFFPPEDIEQGRPEEILRLTSAAGRHEEQGMRVRKDGSQFLASLTFTALYDKAGHLRGFSEFSHDRSESMESAAKYRGLLEAAPDAMVVVNEAGEIILVNVQVETQFGYRRDELVGQKVEKIIPEGFAERLIADSTRSVADALAQCIGAGIELSGRRKDGTEFPIEIMLSPLESTAGILVTAAIRNISDRKKSEQELIVAYQVLEESNLELKQFAYVASHDLQSPLRSISGFVQLLKMDYAEKLDDQARDYIRRTVQSIAQMQALIRDLLLYSCVESRSRPFVPVPLVDVFRDSVSLLESSIRDAGGQVTCGELPVVLGDASQLAQLMQNLIGNGLKYHGTEPPHVHVSAEPGIAKNEWIISVRDNGIGIDPKYFGRIFEIFKRLHDQKEYPGTGIGLAVCRRVVERHGGAIWVESEAGRGSNFCFTIPADTAKSQGKTETRGETNDQQSYQHATS
jgi:PAS domain S-box-containing protein